LFDEIVIDPADWVVDPLTVALERPATVPVFSTSETGPETGIALIAVFSAVLSASNVNVLATVTVPADAVPKGFRTVTVGDRMPLNDRVTLVTV
jgi:hypothetical protein